ncbi:MAG: hypothetical protein DCF15_06175 [Phormidesmis priestleyi]|uniref:Uncharacterized protein n=1 Tax=Phormidesmis priestleyi TaxID=268141 RepID=A0A2W4XP71_9CYAN|nr:MAG: hypothetical protein DCF15_06175 [Phormidesmis priestleyi]
MRCDWLRWWADFIFGFIFYFLAAHSTYLTAFFVQKITASKLAHPHETHRQAILGACKLINS